MAKKPEKKEPPTTGHEWDGIREYDNPMPRWWLWTFYACIVWGIGYMIAYPAWPLINGATKGVLGYSSRGEVATQIAAVEARNAPLANRIVELPLEDIMADDQVGGTNGFAYNSGKATFLTFCAQCHGAGAAGNVGYPNLLDNDWLWGGDINEIYTTISHGIRSDDDFDTRYSEMTAFGEFLSDDAIYFLANYVRKISGQEFDEYAIEPGTELFLDNCSGCHMEDGTGDVYSGAPNLTDAIWLYGGDVETLTETIRDARFGVMPAWSARLNEAQLRGVAVFVHAQGGGQ